VVDDRSVTVEIPAGIESGSRMRVPGRGAAGEAGGRSGDLYVEVLVHPDPRFERHGADLVHHLEVGFTEAALGTSVLIPSIEGDDLDLDIPPGTQPGSVFKFSRSGMPRLRRRGRGDLLVDVKVRVPADFDEEQEEALRAYAELMGEHPAEPRRRRRKRRDR
jgi:molecular chaperone DnaJ